MQAVGRSGVCAELKHADAVYRVWPARVQYTCLVGVLCLPAGLLLVWVQGRHLQREREDRQIDREIEEEGGNNRPQTIQYQNQCFYSVRYFISCSLLVFRDILFICILLLLTQFGAGNNTVEQ